jgi:hypothetical protein
MHSDMVNFPSALVSVVVAAFAVAYVLESRGFDRRRIRQAGPLLLWIAAAMVVIWARWPTIVMQASLNPDEAQFIADAIKVSQGYWMPWADVDTYTVGPLLSFVLAPFVALAPSAPYLVSRMLIIACGIGWTAGSFLAVRTLVSASLARLLAAPMLLLLALPGATDIFSLSSEYLPLALLILGAGLAVSGVASDPYGASKTLCGFMLIGLVPYAKTQLIPVAVVLAVALCVSGLITRCLSPKQTAWNILALSAPSLAIGVLVGIVPAIRDGLVRNFLFVSSYASGEVFQKAPTGEILRVLSDGLLKPIGVMFVVMSVIVIVLLIFSQRGRDGRSAIALSTVAVAPVGVWAMVYPGFGFYHYVWVGLIPVLFSVCVLVAWVAARCPLLNREGLLGGVFAFGMIVSVCLSSFVVGNPTAGRDINPEFSWRHLGTLGSGEQIAVKGKLDSCSGEIAVWGWDAGIFVVSNKPHFSPWSTLLSPEGVGAREWMDEALESKPECIVDASGPGQFVFTAPQSQLRSQPRASGLLAKYTLILSSTNYRVYRLHH